MESSSSSVDDFHGCYLLVCENPRFRGRIYIGYTVDPNRRQRQHNLGRQHGGACKTARKGPWALVVIVYGFMNNIQALQFEWAWQHPDESRRLKHLEKKKSKESALAYRIRVLAEMLRTRPWDHLPLTVQWIREEYQTPFPVNLQPPAHMSILSGSIRVSKKTNKLASPEKSERLADESGDQLDNTSITCSICSGDMEDSSKVSCIFLSCSAAYHICCLAKEFCSPNPKQLIPLSGLCPSCNREMLWADIIRCKRGSRTTNRLQQQDFTELESFLVGENEDNTDPDYNNDETDDE